MRTSQNPADVVDGARSLLWLTGPEFLWRNEDTWQFSFDPVPSIPRNDDELKKSYKVNATEVATENESVNKLLDYFSSLTRLKCAVAWILRLKEHLLWKSKGKPDDLLKKGLLSVKELEMGELEVVKLVQKQVFARELEALNDFKWV